MDGKRSQWASVSMLSQVIKVKDEEMLSSAITLAAQKGWLMVGGQPVHSVLLTDNGEAVALKKVDILTPQRGRQERSDAHAAASLTAHGVFAAVAETVPAQRACTAARPHAAACCHC